MGLDFIKAATPLQYSNYLPTCLCPLKHPCPNSKIQLGHIRTFSPSRQSAPSFLSYTSSWSLPWGTIVFHFILVSITIPILKIKPSNCLKINCHALLRAVPLFFSHVVMLVCVKLNSILIYIELVEICFNKTHKIVKKWSLLCKSTIIIIENCINTNQEFLRAIFKTLCFGNWGHELFARTWLLAW